MRKRSTGTGRQATVDLVLMTLRGRQLYALASYAGRGSGVGGDPELPWGHLGPGESLDAAARRIARKAWGAPPGWMEQCGAHSGGSHPGGSALSICYAGVMPWGDAPRAFTWLTVPAARGLGERQREMASAAVAHLRGRVEDAPVAFQLLPGLFTLGELQRSYEGLLGRKLHKASFRRALAAAFVVEPQDEVRSGGRGRPAQLFRFAPHGTRLPRRGVRFDLG